MVTENCNCPLQLQLQLKLPVAKKVVSRIMNPKVKQAQDWLRAYEEELLADYRSLLQIPSLESDPQPNAPFGIENRRALDLCLAKATEWGMKTTDLEGYLGYADFGSGERLVMSLGHLDVVPVGPGWKHEPFGAEIDGGYVYARGAEDDKGPTIASFYAMRAIKEVFPDIPARLRQAFGCNEESGFKCVERYVQTEEAPTFGVAPDSGWPLYHAEKGIANLEITAKIPTAGVQLISIRGGQRPNIVIDSCEAVVKIAAEVRSFVESALADNWDNNVTFTWNGDTLTVSASGKAAHGATPHEGDSAAVRCFRFLRAISPLPDRKLFDELFQLGHYGGQGLGIAGADEPSGDLTSNLGIVDTSADGVELLFNIRYPVTWTGEQLTERCRAKLAKYTTNFELKVTRDSPPLYFPLEHPLVKAIVDVYERETGERLTPGTMGGGTYARAVANTVSIGTGWEGDGPAHETDERLKIEHLYKMSRIYAHILIELATMEV